MRVSSVSSVLSLARASPSSTAIIRACDAVPAVIGVDQHLGDVGPVRLVARRRGDELRRPDERPRQPRLDERHRPRRDPRGDGIAPECARLLGAERVDEADAGAGHHAGMEERTEGIDVHGLGRIDRPDRKGHWITMKRR